MQVKALRGVFGAYGSVRRGQVIDIPDHQAQQLVKRGTFVPVQAEGAKQASARPSEDKSQSGGQNGAEKSSSSSRRGRPRKASHLKKGGE